jgi:hypothetical protein
MIASREMRRDALVAAALLLVALGLYARFALRDALPSAPHSDAAFAVQNARGFIDGLSEGRFYPRWVAESNRGHGAPTFLYYPPGVYYLVAAAHLVTQDLLAALRATGVLLAALSGIAFVVAARRWAGLRAAAFGAAVYLALPYHLLDLYERFALAEFGAFVWYPLVFACADRLLDGPSRRAWIALALCYAALVFTHLVSGFMLAFVLVPYLGVRAAREGCWPRLVPFGAAIALGLACSAVFVLPVFAERDEIQMEYANEVGRFDWRRNLLFRDEVAAGYSRATVKPVIERRSPGAGDAATQPGRKRNQVSGASAVRRSPGPSLRCGRWRSRRPSRGRCGRSFPSSAPCSSRGGSPASRRSPQRCWCRERCRGAGAPDRPGAGRGSCPAPSDACSRWRCRSASRATRRLASTGVRRSCRMPGGDSSTG